MGSAFRIKRDPAKLVASAVAARSTQAFGVFSYSMRFIIVSIVALNLIVAGSRLEARRNDDPFKRVPSSRRAQLKSRLNDFVRYHAASDWEHVYDLLFEDYKTAQKIPTKEIFLQKQFYSHLTDFDPLFAYRLSDDWWWIRGCGTFAAHGRLDTLVEAKYANHNWYFSNFGDFPLGCVECKALDCKP
jgi:hypothetical protein